MIDFRGLFEASLNPYLLLDPRLVLVEMNPAYLRVTGRSREELVGRYLFDAFPGDAGATDDAQVRELRASFERVLATSRPDILGLIRYSIPIRSGGEVKFEERYWSATNIPLLDADGRVRYILQNTVDVSELQRLKQELRQARRGELPLEQVHGGVLARAQGLQEANRALDSQYRHLIRLFDEAPGFMAYLSGPEHRFELLNPAYSRLVGGKPVLGLTVHEALPEVLGQGYFELLDQVYASGEAFVGEAMEIELPGANGRLEKRSVDFLYQPVRGSDGTVTGILVQGHDVTAQARAQAELQRHQEHLEELVRERTRELAERDQALLHAQKMEAVGKLTGGVAHDFNNVLQVIGANLQLIRDRMADDPDLLRRLDSAGEAVERGSRLSSQLLAFARQQPLRPVVFNMAARLQALEDLLRRTLSEDVELRMRVRPDLANVEVDVHQLENAVLNLAINARDAMPGGGVLEIDIRNAVVPSHPLPTGGGADPLPPGEYVLLEVIDSGHGMAPAVRERAFEPFFTTKPEGEGTGLGLSMVYGFVRQSGGHVRIDSQPGQGTRIGLFLPVVDAPATPLADPAPRTEPGRGEKILVVEDDPAVRAGTVALLQSLGYAVQEAPDASRALAMLEAGYRPDLLFTDVVMPGPLRSPELAARARALHPAMAVLFTSGYTRDVVFHHGRLDPGVELIDKPYTRDALATRLRRLLPFRSSPAAPSGARMRVLLVEDEPDSRRLTAELLERQGHHVAAVADGEEALGRLAAGDWQVLLADVGLPGMDGPELARRATRQWPGLAVVFLSGYPEEDLRAAGITAPLVQKPFTPRELEDALQRVAAAPGR